MSGGLLLSDGSGGVARCIRCGAVAVGPCARCHEPVCGDCCVLTEGGAKVWAICLACEDRGGRSLSRGWRAVIGWIATPILVLLLLVLLLSWGFGACSHAR
jgi:hypothetical protein